MTYAEKLKDPQWLSFRHDFISRQPLGPDDRRFCYNCGDAYNGSLHVHHRRYVAGKEPWQYDDADLLLVCDNCHESIHKVEERARDLVRSLDPHEARQFEILLDALEAARAKSIFKAAVARAKNAVREIL